MEQENKDILVRMLARGLAHQILSLLIAPAYLVPCDKTFRAKFKTIFLVSSFRRDFVLGNLSLT